MRRPLLVYPVRTGSLRSRGPQHGALSRESSERGLYLTVDPSASRSKKQAWRANLTAKSRREDISQREGSVPKALPSSVHLKTMGHYQGHLDITRNISQVGGGPEWSLALCQHAYMAATTVSFVVTHVTMCLILLYAFEWYKNHLIPKTTQ